MSAKFITLELYYNILTILRVNYTRQLLETAKQVKAARVQGKTNVPALATKIESNPGNIFISRSGSSSPSQNSLKR
jgi:hypothetical protein